MELGLGDSIDRTSVQKKANTASLNTLPDDKNLNFTYRFSNSFFSFFKISNFLNFSPYLCNRKDKLLSNQQNITYLETKRA